jgi:hypothetical protein
MKEEKQDTITTKHSNRWSTSSFEYFCNEKINKCTMRKWIQEKLNFMRARGGGKVRCAPSPNTIGISS